MLDIGEAISEILCPVWCSLVKREIEKLEIALQRTTKVIRDLKHMASKERLERFQTKQAVRLVWFGKEKAKKKIIATYEYLKGSYKHNGDKFLSTDAEDKSGRSCALRFLNWTRDRL